MCIVSHANGCYLYDVCMSYVCSLIFCQDVFHRNEQGSQVETTTVTTWNTMMHDRKMMFAIRRAVLLIPACYLGDVVTLL